MFLRLSIFRSKSRSIMRQLAAFSLASAVFAAGFAALEARADELLTVTVDQARIVKVPAGTRTLVIGNPMIADVTLLKTGDTMVVTGKGFGETNFIALDGAGKPL